VETGQAGLQETRQGSLAAQRHQALQAPPANRLVLVPQHQAAQIHLEGSGHRQQGVQGVVDERARRGQPVDILLGQDAGLKVDVQAQGRQGVGMDGPATGRQIAAQCLLLVVVQALVGCNPLQQTAHPGP